ncbi:hypothetical protein [Acinetobacter pittii]|uniref:hypothetical protein n=1 Tax=Acinetobacter pittii TaxID=48296 RepID=UPI000A3B0AB0|nr:hypothetical protein [Acinetobacter pittii]OTU22147.1 hypothetical protein CAT62_06135 [Acinetobacter pittii]
MTKFENLKIEILNESHLQDVCSVLEDIGYTMDISSRSDIKFVLTFTFGKYQKVKIAPNGDFRVVDLLDLQKIRDELKEESKEG